MLRQKCPPHDNLSLAVLTNVIYCELRIPIAGHCFTVEQTAIPHAMEKYLLKEPRKERDSLNNTKEGRVDVYEHSRFT